MGRMKKPTKGRISSSLSVPPDINVYFQWLKEEEIERSPVIVELIRKSKVYNSKEFKQYLKEIEDA